MKLAVGLALVAGVLSAPTPPLAERLVHIGIPAGGTGVGAGAGGSVGFGAHVGAGVGGSVGGGIEIREVSEPDDSANPSALEIRQLHIGIPAGAAGAGASIGGGGSVSVGTHAGAGVGAGIGIREASQ